MAPRRPTAADRQEAAETLRRLIAMIDAAELAAPAWYRERLIGAALALDPPLRSVR